MKGRCYELWINTAAGYFLCLMLSFASPLFAATIYVDQALENNITNSTYSVIKRNGTGSDGDAYKTLQEALDAMNPGDHLYLRGGMYQEGHIRLDRAKNGTDWREVNYNLIASFPGEWAVLDGKTVVEKGVIIHSWLAETAVHIA